MLVHRGGSTASQRSPVPNEKRTSPTATIPSPSQIAHQSSFFHSSVQRERVDWTVARASIWLMISPIHMYKMYNCENHNTPGVNAELNVKYCVILAAACPRSEHDERGADRECE